MNYRRPDWTFPLLFIVAVGALTVGIIVGVKIGRAQTHAPSVQHE